MKRQKWLAYFSRSCAFLGGLVDLSIAIPILYNLVFYQNWAALPFPILLIIDNLLVLVFIFRNLRTAKDQYLYLVWGTIGLFQVFFIYLARFTVGIYLIPPTIFLLISAVFDFFLPRNPLSVNQSLPATSFPNPSPGNQAGLDNGLSTLSSKEHQVLKMLMLDMSNEEIAQTLVISSNTVRHHVHQILKKLKCSSRTQAAAIGRKGGVDLEGFPYLHSRIHTK